MKKVVVGIIEREQGGIKQYLLISATKNFGEFTGFYYPSGGHMEDGENEQTTVTREIKEELNLDVLPTQRIAETAGDIKDQITYWWLCQITGGEIQVQKEEIADVRWFSETEIRNSQNIWPATKKVFLDFIFSLSQK
ncbi:MAG: NUDIX hydrolase [Microgenomates group bacterium]